MTRTFKLLLLISIALGCSHAMADPLPPAEGDTLPDIILEAPKTAEALQYLGVSGEGTFRISDIDADLVIIEIFSMYCPYCQKEAPAVNRLYEAIGKSGAGGKRVKMIGIGMGNTPFEVDIFKRTFKVPFPLFPDADFTIHKKIGAVRTPYFIAVRIGKDKSRTIAHVNRGSLGDPGKFLDTLLAKAGLE